MMKSQTAVHANIGRYWKKFKKAMPEVAVAYEPLPMEVYKDGVLSARHKRLMALVGALTNGCRGCILYQTEHALAVGATVEEILEACAVAVSLGGTMASAETARVMEFLTEKKVLE